MRTKKGISRKILTGLFVIFLSTTYQSAQGIVTSPDSGIFDCMKAKGYSKKGVFVKAFNKSPELKSEGEWLNSYTFARLFTGYPNCFGKSDVSVMRKYVTTVNGYCTRNPDFGSVCLVARGYGPLAWWVYGNG